jgi:hypothetical protein
MLNLLAKVVHRRPLRARGKRPRGGAAERTKKFAPPHVCPTPDIVKL